VGSEVKEKQEISDDQMAEARKRLAGASVSKMIASAIGDMVTLYSKDPAHKHFSFADMEWKILPPIVNGQFFVQTADDPDFGTLRPIGLVTWAKVSNELDERLSKQAEGEMVRLRPQEWASGDNHWLVDVVGTPEGIRKVLTSINEKQLSGESVKVAMREKNVLKIKNLSELIASWSSGNE